MDENTTTSILTGVIYSWTNTTANSDEFNWCYIGSTIHEYNRKSVFKSTKSKYAGKKINDARKEYGIAAFQYQVIEIVTAPDETTLKMQMNEREKYYINKFNSTITGYNTALYGKGQNGIKLSDETKKKMSDSHKKIAVRITDASNNTITIFPSLKSANKTLDIPLSSMHKILSHGGGEWKNFKIEAA